MLVPLTARQTTDMAAAALASGRGAGLPELLELIQTLANRMEHISLGDIAELVEQDPVVSARLISMANMIANNPGMTPLTNVTHAIHQIGFQRVRSLAISLMLLKSSGARQNPPEQRQAASRALCAGLIAQACAKQITAVDTEMVFACARACRGGIGEHRLSAGFRAHPARAQPRAPQGLHPARGGPAGTGGFSFRRRR
jgi:HD-like signal output (HDOD) protein